MTSRGVGNLAGDVNGTARSLKRSTLLFRLRSESIQPVGINITKDGKTGFVALGPANRIAVIDAATHEVRKYLLVGQRVWHMSFTPDEKYLLTTNGLSNDVSVEQCCQPEGDQVSQVGESPWGVTISKQ